MKTLLQKRILTKSFPNKNLVLYSNNNNHTNIHVYVHVHLCITDSLNVRSDL